MSFSKSFEKNITKRKRLFLALGKACLRDNIKKLRLSFI